jgi:hypothetical protein
LAETSPPSLCGSKRPAPEKTFENPTKRKNEDYIEDDMDVEIEKKKLRTIPLKVQIKQCQTPPPQCLLRKVDDLFVASRKDQLKTDPTGPGVPPLALLCIEEKNKEKFRRDLAEQYTYEVIGGLHSVEARKRLLKDHSCRDI